MDIPPAHLQDATVEQRTLDDRIAQQYFVCTGFLLEDAWFPRTVVVEIGCRIGVAGEASGAAAVQRLIDRGWLRASPNDRWLKLTATAEQRADWERQPTALRSAARQLIGDVLLGLTHELLQSGDDETLALMLRQQVHLARLAYAAQDEQVRALLIGIGDGFERLGLHAEARTAYDDAAAALLKLQAARNSTR